MASKPPYFESHGEAINHVLDGFRLFPSLAVKYLLKYGLAKPSLTDGLPVVDREAWFPRERWLQMFDAIAQEVGTGPLFHIGKAIQDNAMFPPEINDIETALRALDIAYHLNQRVDGVVAYDPATGAMLDSVGHYGYQKVPGENKVVSECTDPFPCDLDRGILTGLATRFVPKARVIHQDGSCRKKGDKSCTYIITW